ncbi:MAG: hypothetical protein KDD94_14900 [Calditrichaeota bacterium]|nr:hypothetical protein [Calditrichota bacterium]
MSALNNTWANSFHYHNSMEVVNPIKKGSLHKRKPKSFDADYCQLSTEEIKSVVEAIRNDERIKNIKHRDRQHIYEELVGKGLLTDEDGKTMSIGTFGKYFSIVRHIVALNTDYFGSVKKCLVYRLSAEVISAIVGLPEKDVISIIKDIKRNG